MFKGTYLIGKVEELKGRSPSLTVTPYPLDSDQP